MANKRTGPRFSTHEPDEHNLLDVHQTASRLKMSPRSVQRLVSTGELPVLREGHGKFSTLFDVAAVDEYWRRKRTLSSKLRRMKQRTADQ